jgi:uncharacterized surface anchored protein
MLHKQDQAGNPLKGAEFTLYEDIDGMAEVVSAPGLTNQVKSDSDGLVQFTNVPYGSYYIQETSAPADYIGSSEEIPVNLSDQNELSDSNPSGQIINGNSPAHLLDLGVVSNTIKKGTIQFIKNGINGPLGGAKFTLYNASGTCAIKDSNGNPVTATSVGGTGLVTFTNIPYGDYILKETGAPENYETTASVSVSLHDSTVSAAGVLTLNNIMDALKQTSITIHVTDKNGAPSPGDILVLIDENGVPLGATVKTDADGNATFEDVPYGNYQINNLSSAGTSSITVILNGDNPTTSYNMQNPISNPKTGDNQNPPYMEMFALVISSTILIAKKRRYHIKRRNSNDGLS